MRNKPIEVNKTDIVICIENSFPYKKGQKYKIKNVDDEYVTLYCDDKGGYGIKYNYFTRISKLAKVLKEYNKCEYEDVKRVLDYTLSEMRNMTFFEDAFITQKVLRKQKLIQIDTNKGR